MELVNIKEEILKEVGNITNSRYLEMKTETEDKEEITLYALVEILNYYKELQDEFNEFKEYVNDNYKPISKGEQYE